MGHTFCFLGVFVGFILVALSVLSCETLRVGKETATELSTVSLYEEIWLFILE